MFDHRTIYQNQSNTKTMIRNNFGHNQLKLGSPLYPNNHDLDLIYTLPCQYTSSLITNDGSGGRNSLNICSLFTVQDQDCWYALSSNQHMVSKIIYMFLLQQFIGLVEVVAIVSDHLCCILYLFMHYLIH